MSSVYSAAALARVDEWERVNPRPADTAPHAEMKVWSDKAVLFFTMMQLDAKKKMRAHLIARGMDAASADAAVAATTSDSFATLGAK